MKATQKTTLLALLALTALSASGCMMADGFMETQPCEDSLDCQKGWKCNLLTGYCEEQQTFSSIVDFELTPEQGTSSAATQVPEVDLSELEAGEETPLELNKAVAFTGWVKAGLGVPGSLFLTRDPEFDARKLTWNFLVAQDGYFESELAYKRDDDRYNVYSAVFRPSNREAFPQFKVTGLTVTEDGLEDHYLQFPEYLPPDQLDQQTELLVVKLQILQSEGYPHPVTGIQVEATTDQGLRTNLATPDELGFATLKLPVTRPDEIPAELDLPQTMDLVLKPADASIRLPTVRYENVTLVRMDPADPDLGVYYVGDVPASHSVTGVVVSDTGQPVPDCQLRFAAGGIGYGTFEKTIQADPEGAFSTTLPGGSYTVLAVPGLYDDVRLGAQSVEVGPDQGPVTISLAPRLILSGQVRDPDGQPVPSVLVQAKRISDWNGLEDGIARTFETTTDEDGQFELLADTGAYTLNMVPPAATGLPRQVVEDVLLIDSDLAMDLDDTRLPDPQIIQGHVFSHVGTPMCGVTVDVYRSDEVSATLIGQGVSSSDNRACSGAYTVVVPAAQ